MKTEYSSPEFLFVRVEITTVLTSSPENFNSHVDDTPIDDDPIIDPPDGGINW